MKRAASRSAKAWAESNGISSAETVPPVKGYKKPYARTATEVAARTLILHGVAAVAFDVDSKRVVKWLRDQELWDAATPKERRFLQAKKRTARQKNEARWQCECEWALLWTIRKVKSLGLPTDTCDTGRLVDKIMPPLGADVARFIAAARLRPPAELLAEDDRIYNLHCCARVDQRKHKPWPDDLNYAVLYYRHYAFDWLNGHADWDDVTCDT
jgi:hypothetical protein